MKKGYLPRKWVQWRRYRYQACIAEGLAAPLAHGLATAEAMLRHRASKVIGFKAACDAELSATDKGISIEAGIAGLTDDQIDRLGSFVIEARAAAS